MRICFHIARKRRAWAQTCSPELFAKIGRRPICAPTPAGFCCVTECAGDAEAEPGQPIDSYNCGKPPGDWNREFRGHKRLNSRPGPVAAPRPRPAVFRLARFLPVPDTAARAAHHIVQPHRDAFVGRAEVQGGQRATLSVPGVSHVVHRRARRPRRSAA